MLPRAVTLLAPALAGALLLAGCSEDDGSPTPADGETSSSLAAEPSDYLEVPDGVELTAQGSELSLGETASVAYEPRQGDVAALDLTVTAIERASFKLFTGWKLNEETLATTPYFVRVKAENAGDLDLGGRRIPLYAVDGDNLLVESSTFSSTFKPCPSESLPKKFGTGDSFKTCLVYLAPDKGEITATSFRPVEKFDPITWTGEITRPKALTPDKEKQSKGKKGKKGGKKKGEKG